jgi:hypothetical protein
LQQNLQSLRQRAAVEALYELRRHPEPLVITMLATYCHMRGQDLTDTLVDLLLDIVHHIASKAEIRAEQQLIEELKRIAGKNRLLFRLTEAPPEHPDGIIKEVGVRISGRKRAKAPRPGEGIPIHRTRVSQKDANGDAQLLALPLRRLLLRLLDTLEFQSGNDRYRLILCALALC